MAEKPFKIINSPSEGFLEVKKSKFIATMIPISSESEAVDFIQATKKKYWDAKHNCSAFVLGEKNEVTRCNDDGEPAQTAGRPMLDVLLNENVHNVAVVVTRYFGGVLLGTGGLVKAYQGAVIEALNNAEIYVAMEGKELSVETDYNGSGKITYLLNEKKVNITDTIYGQGVEIKAVIPIELEGEIEKSILDATSGQAKMQWSKQKKFPIKL